MTQRTDYDESIAESICHRLAEGESLRAICRSDGMPARSTVHLWVLRHPEFEQRYEQARRLQADAFVDDVVDIADNSTSDRREDGTWDTENIMRARLRVDTRKWVAGKMHPRRYGERITQEHVGEGGGPIKVQAVDFTDDELAAIAARGRD